MMRLTDNSGLRSAAVSLLLLLALIVINVFIYSPWHQHNTLSRQTCDFFQFEHGSADVPVTHVHLAPPTSVLADTDVETIGLTSRLVLQRRRGRAPPATL